MQELFKQIDRRIGAMDSLASLQAQLKSNSDLRHDSNRYPKNEIYLLYKEFSKIKRDER